MRRIPNFEYRVATPDGLVHRIAYNHVEIGVKTACDQRLATLYLPFDKRTWEEQVVLTDVPTTCLACALKPDEVELEDELEDDDEYGPFGRH